MTGEELDHTGEKGGIGSMHDEVVEMDKMGEIGQASSM